MSNGLIEIEEFEQIKDTEVKLNILFKTMVCHIKEIDRRFEAGNQRFKRLENRKLIDKVYSGIGGIIGGVIAALGLKWGVWK